MNKRKYKKVPTKISSPNTPDYTNNISSSTKQFIVKNGTKFVVYINGFYT